MRSPAILLALALSAGIVLGQAFLFFPWSTISLVAVLAAAGVLLLRRGVLDRAALAAGLSGMLAGALLLAIAAGHVPASDYRHLPLFDGAVHEVTGRISSPLDRDPGRTAFSVNLEQIDGREASGTIRVTVRDEAFSGGYGDRVALSARPSPPRGYRNPGGFDYPAYLARQGIHAVLSLKQGADVRVLERGGGVLRTIQDLRERIRQAALRSLSGDGAAVLLAMTIGEEGNLTDDLRERFMAAGVTHIISISGSHLGMVAVICFWLVRNALFLLPERAYHWLTLRVDPRKIAAVATVVPVVFYAFLAGGQVATMRSLIMILAGLAALVFDREGDLTSALALAALITLLPDPQALFDISFQLSYLSVLSIVWVVSTWNTLVPAPLTRARRLLHNALLLLVVSLAASLVTGPLVAHHFRQASLAGILANMVVVPFAGAIVVPLGLLCGIMSLATGSFPLPALNQQAADAFVSLVTLFARLPFASVHLPSPGPLFAIGYAGLLASSALRIRHALFAAWRPLESSSRAPRWSGAIMALSAVMLALSLLSPLVRAPEARATFIDVGQGDSTLVETPSGAAILIDGGGTRDNRFDVGGRVLAPYLRDRGIRTIDLVILSHPHPDHLNGLLAVLKGFRVREVWGSGLDADLPGYADLAEAARRGKTRFRAVSAGHHADLGGAEIDVLHPRTSFRQRAAKAYVAENDRSLVVRVSLAGRVLLFPGDIHVDGEQELLRYDPGIAADLVKVPHHGSRTSSTPAFVEALRPAVAVMTAGAGNPYRHPSAEVVSRYEGLGAKVFRTDRHGAIIVRLGRTALDVRAWADLVLRTISLKHAADWWSVERENGKRLMVRTGGT